MSIMGYVAVALTIFRHKHPRNPQDQPYPYMDPKYGTKSKYAEATYESPPLSKEHKKIIQEATVTLLQYARAVDPTIIISLGSIVPQQANPAENMMQKLKQLLDYTSSHPDSVITYQASEMVLVGHSDASYLSKTKARSRAGGHFFMSNNTAFSPNNGAVFTIAKIIKAVMSSAAEAELGSMFINCN